MLVLACLVLLRNVAMQPEQVLLAGAGREFNVLHN
jgi:hypothetical protein